MRAHLERQKREGPELFPLEGERVTIGKDPSSDLSIPEDPLVSRLHALLEQIGSGWIIRDLDSRNGTYVNGERIWRDRPLRSGDEIGVGNTTIVFRTREPAAHSPSTQAAVRPPELTRRERDVLVALCRPLLAGDVFTEPAPIRAVAKELVITEAAVKQHLARLYDKFGLHDRDQRRRARLANEALHTGVVRLVDLRAPRTHGD